MTLRAERKAVRRFPRVEERRPRFVVADAGALPVADESIDLVVSSYAVHHLPDRHAARAEIMRVLKPGAKAIIWDVASPHGAAADGDRSPHGGHAPDKHTAGALDVIRMLIRFGRIPAERYELRKRGG